MEQNPENLHEGQLNPGSKDQSGEVTIKKNEGISDQGNEWTDKEEISKTDNILGEKAEKYIKDSGDVEDLPEEVDDQEADRVTQESQAKEKMADDDDGENEDDVIEDPDDYVPGYDLGRNKVQ